MKRITMLGLALLIGTTGSCRPSEAEVVDRGAVGAVEDDQNPHLRRVWAKAGDYATPSPDGRLITFVDWSTGDVAVHDVATGEDRRITDKGTWTENGSWAEYPIFSPDGREVVYAYGNVLTGDPFRYELRRVTLGDTTQHLLRSNGDGEYWLAPLDWSERGILFTHYTTFDRSSLQLLDPETGEATVLEPEFGRAPGAGREARFSPDSRWVAYVIDGLKVRDLERGTVAAIDFPTTALIDWTMDGRGLIVHSAYNGRTGLWRIPISGGRMAGPATLVRDGIPAVMQGGSRAGEAFYYTIPVDAPRVHVASVDIPGARMLSAPSAITTPMDGMAHFSVWSPDGAHLAYLLRALNNQGPTRLMVRQADGDQVRELASLRVSRITSMAWTPDGKEILLLERGTRDLHAVSVQDGAARVVLSNIGDIAAIAPDGRTLAAVLGRHTDRSDDPAIVAVDLISGTRRTLEALDDRPVRSISYSPDGRTLAYVTREEGRGASEIRALPADGGTSRTLARKEFPQHFEGATAPLAWSPDGRYLVAGGGEWEGEDSHDLWAVAVDGSGVRPLGMPGFSGPEFYSLHPAGNRLAFIAGDRRNELWVLDRIDG